LFPGSRSKEEKKEGGGFRRGTPKKKFNELSRSGVSSRKREKGKKDLNTEKHKGKGGGGIQSELEEEKLEGEGEA